MSKVSTNHPLYVEFAQDWAQMRKTYRGERIVKEHGFPFLPPTSGMVADGVSDTSSDGFKAYTAYRVRARFPELVKEAVESMLGVMHAKPPVIELPKRLEGMLERATLRNETMPMLLRRINEEQLITGRLGILLEVPDGPPPKGSPVNPFIALFNAEHLINWDEGEVDMIQPDSLNMVVIDETEEERFDGFNWKEVKKHRVLVLGDPFTNEQTGLYSVAVLRDDAELVVEDLESPSIQGRTLKRIPFQFINTKDVVPTPEDAPLLGLSNLSLTIYRGEADYRQSLYLQGQDTLVEIGNSGTKEGEATRVGTGAKISLPVGGDAKFIGVDSAGLEEQRLALVNDYQMGNQKAGALLEAVSRSAESGEALRVRVSARTASLNQIAMAGAFGLRELLRTAAEWVGANPDEVVVEPNLDFVDDTMAGKELVDIMAAKGLGAPISLDSIHQLEQERGLTTKTFEEELAQMELEESEGMPGATPTSAEDAESETADGEDTLPVTDPDEEPDEDDDKEKGGDDE